MTLLIMKKFFDYGLMKPVECLWIDLFKKKMKIGLWI